jgi:alpha-ketoglutarate-dependent 2,4-dichlorophenoxyacetate dioxygenase
MQLQPIGPRLEGGDLAALATHIDLRQPPTAAQRREIEQAMDHYGVLVFRNQPLDEHQQIAFAQSLGPLDVGLRKIRGGPHRFAYNELADISNVDVQGTVVDRNHSKIVNNVANQLWHCDSSFQKPRAKYSMLAAGVVPAFGGETEFADLRLAYGALPGWLKAQLGCGDTGLQAQHWALHSRLLLGDTGYTEAQRAAFVPVTWPLVQTDPRTGRRILYVGAHANEVLGMTVPEGRMLLMDLIEHASQRAFVYRHEWQVGDLVMWDNTATMHRGRWFDFAQRRELRRATTLEVVVEHKGAPTTA